MSTQIQIRCPFCQRICGFVQIDGVVKVESHWITGLTGFSQGSFGPVPTKLFNVLCPISLMPVTSS